MNQFPRQTLLWAEASPLIKVALGKQINANIPAERVGCARVLIFIAPWMNAKLWRCFWFLSPSPPQLPCSALKRPMRLSFSRISSSLHTALLLLFMLPTWMDFDFAPFDHARTALSRLALSLARLLPKSFYSATSAESSVGAEIRSPRSLENNSIVTFANFCIPPRLRSDELLCAGEHTLRKISWHAAHFSFIHVLWGQKLQRLLHFYHHEVQSIQLQKQNVWFCTHQSQKWRNVYRKVGRQYFYI
jgi:hypothetical protein